MRKCQTQFGVDDILSIQVNITLEWMPEDHVDGKSTLIQVMAWCHQATSHYLNQCWPRFLIPCGATRPQWVNVVVQFVLWPPIISPMTLLTPPDIISNKLLPETGLMKHINNFLKTTTIINGWYEIAHQSSLNSSPLKWPPFHRR